MIRTRTARDGTFSALVVLGRPSRGSNTCRRGTKPWPLPRHLAQPLPQFVVGDRRRRPSKRPAIQTNERARPALRIVALFNHLLHSFSAPRGRTHLFPRTPCRPRWQGFAQSLRDLALASLPVPSYTTLCIRAQALEIKLPIVHDSDPIHVAGDSSGMKVAGEWNVLQPGHRRSRAYTTEASDEVP